jgi:hypothetical protein
MWKVQRNCMATPAGQRGSPGEFVFVSVHAGKQEDVQPISLTPSLRH